MKKPLIVFLSLLFAAVSADGSPFHIALGKYYSGADDRNTLAILAAQTK